MPIERYNAAEAEVRWQKVWDERDIVPMPLQRQTHQACWVRRQGAPKKRGSLGGGPLIWEAEDSSAPRGNCQSYLGLSLTKIEIRGQEVNAH
jgi:hypothetical protein